MKLATAEHSPLRTEALLLLLAAPIAGSAAASFARRWPDDVVGWLTGRSRCPQCGTPLGPADLVPLVSFLALRGRCRHCHGRIDPYYPAVEVAAGLLTATALLILPLGAAVVASILAWTLLAAALVDRRLLLLPDALTLPLVAAGLIAPWLGWPLVDPATSLIGAAAGFATTLAVAVAYRRLRGRDGLGRGDAKLLAAAGAWCGWQALPAIVLVAAASALTAALASGAHRRPTEPVPFGPWLALGFWAVLLLKLHAVA